MKLTNNYLEKLRGQDLIKLSKFIVKENFEHHSGNLFNVDYEKDIESIFKEEKQYLKNAKIYVSKNYSGDILGSIRVLKWNYFDKLPLHKLFNINPFLFINNNSLKPVWHIGRFAIKKGVNDINLFKKLMICAITPICMNKDSIAFAECDSKLLRILNLLGIETTIIGDPIYYLGSETIPISMTYGGLINFYNKNKHLVSRDILTSNIDNNNTNYSFV